jgi:hypothetical protein
MRYSLLVLLFFSLVLISCKTNPPNSVESEEFGRIFVSANVTGAEIYVNDQNTGKVTPDTLRLNVGSHTIRVEKTDYLPAEQSVNVIKDQLQSLTFTLLQTTVQKTVLIEDFGNVSCNPCVISNQIIEQLVNETYGHAKLIAIKFPTNFPGPSDPFYLHNPSQSDDRMSYYNILFAPTIIVDGTARPIATDSISIKNDIDTRLQITPAFQITISDSIAGNNYLSEITLNVLSLEGIDMTNAVMHTVIVETDIEFSSPPGSNGETKFFNVMRSMNPSSAGESLSGITQAGEYSYNRQYAVPSVVNGSKLHTVVFIQNSITKEIFQAASTH